MSHLLDEQYLKWLYAQVGSVKLKNPSRTYWSLARQLYTKEYDWFIPNDDNRVEDGRDLRYQFLEECDLGEDQEWLGLDCSMLEMVIGLSRRLSFLAEGEPRDWFWHLLDNLGILFTDRENGPHRNKEVRAVLDSVVKRDYHADGRGGLFPLRHPDGDQRLVEVWDQMNSYLDEQSR